MTANDSQANTRNFLRGVWSRASLLTGIYVAMVAAAGARAADGAVDVRVTENTADRIVVRFDFGAHVVRPVDINGGKYVHLQLGDESVMKDVGAPALPQVCRSVILPNDASMTLNVIASDHFDVADVDVAPSKGFLPRTINPADVAFTFGAPYRTDAMFPIAVATLGDPYILRDYRGAVVRVYPIQCNPVTHTLRVYRQITVELVRSGPAMVNPLHRPANARETNHGFHQIYARRFINYDSAERYLPLDEDGDLLILAHDAWLSNVQPLAAHKNARGIHTTVVGVSTIPGGNTSTAIKNYIQSVYNTSNLAYVLLVGDSAEVATPHASGGASDPSYALLAGGDHYPDIFVGRFSAQSPADVDTQVWRTIDYEQAPAQSLEWFWKGMGIASNQGPGDDGELDYEHVDNIRLDLLDYGYTLVDQIYDPTATAAQVTAGLNAGRGIINYTGHGSTTSWGTTGFSNSNVNALVNDHMLPFIFSVACVNGEFEGTTCFAEAWLRATHGDAPTGAIGMYASSINQSWDPPMAAQDESVDMLVAEAYTTFGALCFAGSCLMMDEYGSGGVEMYDTWHVFGDPSLRVVMRCLDQGTVALDRPRYACESEAVISVLDCGLNANSGAIETVTVTIASDSDPSGQAVLLTETGADTAEFEGPITLSEVDGPGIFAVQEGDTVTVTYIDADDGMGGTNVEVTDTAIVDCTPPVISNVQTVNVEPRSAVVTFQTDEPSRGKVRYGTSCGALTGEALETGYPLTHAVALTGLQDDTTYFYAVNADDEAGNTAADNNQGVCYTFTTPAVPDHFTEQFDDSPNDLDNFTILFTPNGSNDFYAACGEAITELPTDPSGGTALPMYDDDFRPAALSGGEHVWLYGASYTGFYVGSNGYVTFGVGDGDYSETLPDHFDLPRISGVFDDLNPNAGGTISWKQLEDRAVATWLNVPEYLTSNNNTFQIEMYFDGRLRISYLSVAATDGIAGLSAGQGMPADYFESDLSAVLACGEVLLGDCDHDGDVDLDDFAMLNACFTGPAGGISVGCDEADLDVDGDVDMADFSGMQRAFTGTR